MKKFLDLSGLSTYDVLIKQVIASAQTTADAAVAAAAIAQASADTAHQEALEAMASAQVVDAKVIALSAEVKTLSGVVIDNELVTAHAINALNSGLTQTNADLASLSGKVVSFSGDVVSYVDTKVSALSGNVIEHVKAVSGEIKTYIDAQDQAVSGALISYVDALSGNVVAHVQAVSGDIKTYIDAQDQALSGNVENAIAAAVAAEDAKIGAQSGRIDTIEAKIMTGTTAENQLTNKSYVDTAIQEYAAEFKGTYHLTTDLGLDAESGENWTAVASALTIAVSAVTTSNKNDYAFVFVPQHFYVSGSASGYVESRFDRYAYVLAEGEVPAHYEYEYSLNNSSFTTEQWNAINSKMTSGKTAQFEAHVADTDIHVTTADKDAWNHKASSADMETLSGVVVADKADLQTLSGVVVADKADLATLSGVVVADKADLVAFSGAVIDQYYNKTDIDAAHLTISKAINALETNKATKTEVQQLSASVVSAITNLDSQVVSDNDEVKVTVAQADGKLSGVTAELLVISDTEINGLFQQA